jgi:hypothetical protein
VQAIIPTGTLTDGSVAPEYFKVCTDGAAADFYVKSTWKGPAPAYAPQSYSDVVHINDAECRYVAWARTDPVVSSSATTVQIVAEHIPAGYRVRRIGLIAGPGTPINTLILGINGVTTDISGSANVPPGSQGAMARFVMVHP